MMKRQLRKRGWFVKVGMAAAAIMALASLLRPAAAKAHCDSVEGPVVAAAQAALEANDVTLVLPYVQPGAEVELAAAFKHAREVRALGPEAQELADRFFFETAVRLHRVGEGATYTGLSEGKIEDPSLLAADAVLAGGPVAPVYALLDEALHEGIATRYAAVEEAREHAAGAKTVAADRARVEAELGFEKYIYSLYAAATAAGGHTPEGPTEAAAPAHHSH
jgi:hypothetical protein